MRRLTAVCLVLALSACDDGAPSDAGTRTDAGRRDGGAITPDGGRTDAAGARDGGRVTPTDAGPLEPGCAGRDYLFCEDFEAANVGEVPPGWTMENGWMPGSPMVTDTEHHSGSRAFASALAQTGQPRIRHSLDALGAARGTHWGRVYYKVLTPFFVGGYVHSTLVGLQGSTECRVVDTVLGPDGSHQFLFNIPDDSCCVGSSYDYHSYDDTWHCAEWFIDASTESYRFYFDGDEVTDLAVDGRSDAFIEQFTAISLGWRNYQSADPPYRSFLDDLAIDDERIGCD
ncbi:MAG: hypothetical protein AB7S26_21185 [Sandaracinaceae bacterium]